MLVLTRRVGSRILIGENIWIKILPDKKGNPRIGIDAPQDVPIVRAELLDDSKRLLAASRGEG